ncbi:MAG TPA: hypothetical protein PLL75_05345 [Candidatus Omnitrophota bacterium]|nr:hypothetical protein [Candidatus Omnitrophota bacterium]HPS37133.1 hypothetical protein [Candidatus Omnitrophota bacterium]
MSDMTAFWNIVLTQRTWSWAVVGIVYLLGFLTLRSFFFRSLIKRAKPLNSKWYAEIKKIYLRKSIGGWVLFLLSFLLLIFFWQSGDFQRSSLYEAAMILLVLLTVFLSIMSHLIAFGVAALYVLKQLENNQMTF